MTKQEKLALIRFADRAQRFLDDLVDTPHSEEMGILRSSIKLS